MTKVSNVKYFVCKWVFAKSAYFLPSSQVKVILTSIIMDAEAFRSEEKTVEKEGE